MRFVPFAAGLLAALIPLFAHHGTATSYDQTKTVTIKGTVTEFIWRNPHCALFVDVPGADGKVVNYSIEMYSPSLMVGRGYKRDVFKKGDQITLDIHPSLAGAASGECLGCRATVNGKELSNPTGKGGAKGKAAKGAN